jgi:branched-chain amino acid transport system substrate-binding protein
MLTRLTRAARALGLTALVTAVATGGVSAAQSTARPLATTYTLTIGTSVPLNSGLKQLADGIDKSVQLAVILANQKHLLPNVTFKFRPLDDTVGTNYSPDKDAANARVLIADSTVVGEVGPLNSGAAEASMPIYNNNGLVQISPANTLVLLTDPAHLAQFQPATAKGKGPRTYFRTAVNDARQGLGGARFAHQVAHFKTAYVTDNKDPYGTGLAQQFALSARKLGMKVLGSGELEPNQTQMGARSLATVIKNRTGGNVDLVYFGGEYGPSGGADFLVSALRHVGLMRTTFMGGDGVYAPDFIKAATPAIANGSYATSVGYPPTYNKAFVKAFTKQFPGVAIQGYNTASFDAANVIIQATVNAIKARTFHLGATGSAAITRNREAVARAVAAIHNMAGATGILGFDKNGDTSVRAIISVYKVVNGAWNFIQYAPGFGTPR